MPCDPWGNNPGYPIGFDDLEMNALWLRDPPCKSAAGSYWDVYNRGEGKTVTNSELKAMTPMSINGKAPAGKKI